MKLNIPLSVPLPLAISLLLFSITASAQGGFFEQFFGGPGGGGHPGHQQGPPQNAPSDSGQYQAQFDATHCSNYLCPGTLACVHFPHHCPCAFPDVEDKVELGHGIAVCASKGGYKAGEMARKVELARKGLL